MNDLGWCLFEAGQLTLAEETLTRAVAMDAEDGRARENLRICRAGVARQAETSKRLQPTAPVKRKRRG